MGGVHLLSAQPADSVRVFSQEEFFGWILEYHPVVKQARLLDSEAEALERLAADDHPLGQAARAAARRALARSRPEGGAAG